MVMKWQTMMISAKTGKNCVEPRDMISKATFAVDRHVARSGVETAELCEAFGSTRNVEKEDAEDENEQEMVPSFAETYEALQKVKAFFYAQSGSNVDRENIFKSRKVVFSIEAKFRQEAKDNV
jgi:hypothetical protein